jgi:hypothetical protein
MADKEIKITLVVDGKEVTATLANADDFIAKISKHQADANEKFSQWGNVITGINQGMERLEATASKLFSIVSEGAQFEVLSQNFQGTTQELELLKKATAGTVDEGSLMKLSSQASDLGVSMKNQALAFSYAEDRADKYGGSVEENFQKIVAASEGRTKGLYQVGIQAQVFNEIVKQSVKQLGGETEETKNNNGERELTIKGLDAETQKRIRIDAVIKAAGVTMDDVNNKQKDSKDRLESLTVAIKESEISVGRFVADGIVPLISALQDGGPVTSGFTTIVIGVGSACMQIIPVVSQLAITKKILFTATTEATIAEAGFGSTLIGVLGPIALAAAGLLILEQRIKQINEQTRQNTLKTWVEEAKDSVSKMNKGQLDWTINDNSKEIENYEKKKEELQKKIDASRKTTTNKAYNPGLNTYTTSVTVEDTEETKRLQNELKSYDDLISKNKQVNQAAKERIDTLKREKDVAGKPKEKADKNKAALDENDAAKLAELSKVDRTQNETEVQEKILEIEKKYAVKRADIEGKTTAEKKAGENKANEEYNNKLAELNAKKNKEDKDATKEVIEFGWAMKQKDLEYLKATDLQILEAKKKYQASVKDLYKQDSKEYIKAQQEIELTDKEITQAKNEEQEKRKNVASEIFFQQIENDSAGNEAELKDIELKKKVREEEKKIWDDRTLTEAEKIQLLQEMWRNYDNERLKNGKEASEKSKEQIEQSISNIISNTQNASGALGDAIYNNAKKEAESYKTTEKAKMESDRKTALSHAKTQAQKDKINEEYDAKEAAMEDAADKRAREKAKAWYTVQKAANIAQAIDNTYVGATKVLTDGIWGILEMGTIIAAGMAQVAAIIATPLPGFREGIISIVGPGTETSDSIPAHLSKGESVINAESTKGSAELLYLINENPEYGKSLNDLIFHGIGERRSAGYVDMRSSAKVSSAAASAKAMVERASNESLLNEIRAMNDNVNKLNQKFSEVHKSLEDYNKRPIQMSEKLAKSAYVSGKQQISRSKL